MCHRLCPVNQSERHRLVLARRHIFLRAARSVPSISEIAPGGGSVVNRSKYPPADTAQPDVGRRLFAFRPGGFVPIERGIIIIPVPCGPRVPGDQFPDCLGCRVQASIRFMQPQAQLILSAAGLLWFPVVRTIRCNMP